MSQQVTSETQAKDVGELPIKSTPMGVSDVLLASEDGINVKQIQRHLIDPLRGVVLIQTGLI